MANLLKSVEAVKCDNAETGKARREWVEIRFRDENGQIVRSDSRQELRPAQAFNVWKFLKSQDPKLEQHPAMVALSVAIVKGLSARSGKAAGKVVETVL